MTDRPPELAPMLASTARLPADLGGHLLEPKWDGVRAVVTLHRGQVTVTSRLGNDVTGGYPELAGLAAALGRRSAVVDGEIVAFDAGTGRPSFQRLQRRMHVRAPSPQLRGEVPVRLLVFDVLWLDGDLLIGRPQAERRQVLEGLAIEGQAWHTSPLLPPATPDDLLAACRSTGMEGYVAKRADAPYLPGRRSTAWIKVKCGQRRRFVVGGWAPGRGGRSGAVGSLAVGCWGIDPATGASTGRLHYCGMVGSGLSQDVLRQLGDLFARAARPDSPFAEQLVGPVRFVEPVLVVEVAYNELTEAGTLRQPSVQALRPDLDPAQVLADEGMQEVLGSRPSPVRVRQVW